MLPSTPVARPELVRPRLCQSLMRGECFMRFRIAEISVLISGIALAIACSSPSSPSNTNFSMMIKDAPFVDAKAVYVTFSDVSVHKATDTEDTWTKLAFSGGGTTRTCDLKKLQTASDVLGIGTLAEGHYTHVRLTVT